MSRRRIKPRHTRAIPRDAKGHQTVVLNDFPWATAVLAMQATPSSHLICPLIDARRGEVYFSGYRFRGGQLKKEMDEYVLPPEEVARYLDEPCIFLGNGALLYQQMIRQLMDNTAYFTSPFQNIIRASTVAHLSMARFQNADTDDLGMLVPHYIRKPDAELKQAT